MYSIKYKSKIKYFKHLKYIVINFRINMKNQMMLPLQSMIEIENFVIWDSIINSSSAFKIRENFYQVPGFFKILLFNIYFGF